MIALDRLIKKRLDEMSTVFDGEEDIDENYHLFFSKACELVRLLKIKAANCSKSSNEYVVGSESFFLEVGEYELSRSIFEKNFELLCGDDYAIDIKDLQIYIQAMTKHKSYSKSELLARPLEKLRSCYPLLDISEETVCSVNSS